MAKRSVPYTSHPHMKTGRGQYPVKLAGARPCWFCGQKVRTGTAVIISNEHSLCPKHSATVYIQRLLKIQGEQLAKNTKPRRRPGFTNVKPSNPTENSHA